MRSCLNNDGRTLRRHWSASFPALHPFKYSSLQTQKRKIWESSSHTAVSSSIRDRARKQTHRGQYLTIKFGITWDSWDSLTQAPYSVIKILCGFKAIKHHSPHVYLLSAYWRSAWWHCMWRGLPGPPSLQPCIGINITHWTEGIKGLGWSRFLYCSYFPTNGWRSHLST